MSDPLLVDRAYGSCLVLGRSDLFFLSCTFSGRDKKVFTKKLICDLLSLSLSLSSLFANKREGMRERERGKIKYNKTGIKK